MIRRSSVLALAFCLTAVSLIARKHEKDPVFQQINSIVQTLSRITALTEEHPVEYGTISKKQLHRFLVKRIKKTLKPDEIRVDELALKLFGLVPANFDLKKSTVDLLTEQAAAFYDYDAKKLFLLEGAPLGEEATTLAHELSHGLADQHFDLQKFMDDSPENDDENLAHSAVVEGQATWLMLAYNLVQAGKPPEPTADMLRGAEDTSAASASDFPVLNGSPLYIQQSLLFPYAEGTRFFDAVYRRMGRTAFSAVFLDPPLSSAEIIHPELYFAHRKPAVPDLPKLEMEDGEEEVTTGTLGEFDQRMLLWQYTGRREADRLAPHFRGAQFRVTAGHKLASPVLQYVAQWDSARSAAQYFSAYKKILRAKWTRCEPRSDTDTEFTGVSDSGYFLTHLRGDTMVSVEGLKDEADLAAMPRRKAMRRGES